MKRNALRSWTFWVIILYYIGTAPLLAEEICSKNVVCVVTEQRDQSVIFTVKNLETFEVTVTLEAELENMRANVNLPHTATYPARSATKVMTLFTDNPQKAWRWQYQFHWTLGPLYALHVDTHVYALPYEPHQSFTVLQGFNGRFSHSGDEQYAIDWAMPEGTPVRASRGGVVVGTRDLYSEGGPDPKYRDFSNYVMIKHPDGTIGEYDHFRKDGVAVKVGQIVKVGDLLGFSGNVGFSSGQHLHFFVYKAIDGYRRKSFPIRFKTTNSDAATLREGENYTASQ